MAMKKKHALSTAISCVLSATLATSGIGVVPAFAAGYAAQTQEQTQGQSEQPAAGTTGETGATADATGTTGETADADVAENSATEAAAEATEDAQAQEAGAAKLASPSADANAEAAAQAAGQGGTTAAQEALQDASGDFVKSSVHWGWEFKAATGTLSLSIASGDASSTARTLTAALKEKGIAATDVKAVVYKSGCTSTGRLLGSAYTNVASVELADTVTELELSAFSSMTGLKSVNIPASVTELGNGVFWGCSSLESVTFAAGSKLTTIEKTCFRECTNLKTLDLSGTQLSAVSDSCFQSSGIVSLKLPNTVTKIEDYGFNSMEQLESLTLPSSVASIGKNAFQFCKSLKTLVFPASLQSISSSAFASIYSTNDIGVTFHGTKSANYDEVYATVEKAKANGVKSIAYTPHVDAAAAAAFVVDKDTKTVGYTCNVCNEQVSFDVVFAETEDADKFAEAAEVKAGGSAVATYSVALQQGGMNVLASDKKLTITMPLAGVDDGKQAAIYSLNADGSIAKVGTSAVTNGCVTFTASDQGTFAAVLAKADLAAEIQGQCVVAGGKWQWTYNPNNLVVTLSKLGEKTDGDADVSLADAMSAAGAPIDKVRKAVYAPGTVETASNMFGEKLTALAQVVVPDSVIKVQAQSFANMPALGSMTLPDSVEELGKGVFYGCTVLTAVTLPADLESLPDEAFRNCTALAGVSLPDSLTSIGARAFYGTMLSEIALPEDLESIGEGAFANMTKLASITIPDYVTELVGAFEGDTALETVVFGGWSSDLTKLGDKTFYGCSSLSSVMTLSRSITEIGKNAFYGCEKLTELGLSSTKLAVLQDSFSGSGLASITLPQTLTNVDENALKGLGKIDTVAVPSTVTSIAAGAFSDMASLASLTIPATVALDNAALSAMASGHADLTIYVHGNNSDDATATMATLNAWKARADYAYIKSIERTYHVDPSSNATFSVDPATTKASYTCNICSGTVACGVAVTDAASTAFADTDEVKAGGTVLVSKAIALTDPNNVKLEKLTRKLNVSLPVDAVDGKKVVIYQLDAQGAPKKLAEAEVGSSKVQFEAEGAGTYAVVLPKYVQSDVESGTYTDSRSNGKVWEWSFTRSTGELRVKNTGKSPSDYLTISQRLQAAEVNPDDVKTLVVEDGAEGDLTNSFAGFKGLESVTLSETVTSLRSGGVFKGCPALKEVTLPNAITVVSSSAFKDCPLLEKVTFGNAVKEIGQSAFEGCTALKNVTLPDTLETIGGSAFKGTAIETISLPDGLKAINGSAFSGTKLTTVKIPASVTTLSGFDNCVDLSSVEFADGFVGQSIGWRVFAGCTSLKSLDLSETGITTIGSNGFGEGSAISTLVLPKTLVNVYENAFNGMSELEELVVPQGVTQLPYSGVFKGTSKMKKLVLPAGITWLNTGAIDSVVAPATHVDMDLEFHGDKSDKIDSIMEKWQQNMELGPYSYIKSVTYTEHADAAASEPYAVSTGEQTLESTCAECGQTFDSVAAAFAETQDVDAFADVPELAKGQQVLSAYQLTLARGEEQVDAANRALSVTMPVAGVADGTQVAVYSAATAGEGQDAPQLLGTFAVENGAVTFQAEGAGTFAAVSQNPTWKRLAGNTAIGTMKAIVNEGWDTSDWAIVATTGGYYDALSASGLAGLLDCPILMTASNKLSDATKGLIQSKQVKNVIVVGGTSAVSEAVFNQIKALGVSVERVAGNTAIGTANAIYERGKKVEGGWGSDAIVATAGGFQDALSIAPYAYAKKAPIFLARGSAKTPATLSDSTLSKVKAGGFTRTIITGGTAAVASSVDAEFVNAKRLAGNTAYGTSKLIANFCISEGMTAAHVGVATGQSYYDALAGAALCGRKNSVITLVDDKHLSNVDKVVKPNKDKLQVNCYIFGGTSAVSANVEKAIEAASE